MIIMMKKKFVSFFFAVFINAKIRAPTSIQEFLLILQDIAFETDFCKAKRKGRRTKAETNL